MRYLIVEDDLANQTSLKALIESKDTTPDVTCCRDLASTEEILSRDTYYDLIILDLSIPPSELQLSAHNVSHGLATLEAIRQRAPAAIVRVLTGYPEMDMASQYQNRYQIKQVEQIAALSFTTKSKMLNMGDEVSHVLQFIKRTNAIEIHAPHVILSVPEKRLIFQIALAIPARRCNVAQFKAGRSGARSFKVEMFDLDAMPCGRLFVKMDSVANTSRELDNYRRFVGPNLSVGSLPHLVGDMAAFYDRASISYGLAQEYPYDLFSFLGKPGADQEAVIGRLEHIGARWLEVDKPESLTSRELIGKLEFKVEDVLVNFSDADVKKILAALDFEIRFRHAVQHSDLHGGNVLVAENGEPLLIDFGRVGMLPAPVDAVMLELSFALHPDAARFRNGWPTLTHAKEWADIQRFAEGSPFQNALCACRDWAHRVVEKISNKAIFGIGLTYSLWQLTFSGTDKAIASAIAVASAEALLA